MEFGNRIAYHHILAGSRSRNLGLALGSLRRVRLQLRQSSFASHREGVSAIAQLPQEVTELLHVRPKSDRIALGRPTRIVYQPPRRLANRRTARERVRNALQITVLIRKSKLFSRAEKAPRIPRIQSVEPSVFAAAAKA